MPFKPVALVDVQAHVERDLTLYRKVTQQRALQKLSEGEKDLLHSSLVFQSHTSNLLQDLRDANIRIADLERQVVFLTDLINRYESDD